MKILIVGAGVIGTTYGWALSESGHDVTHFVKPSRQDQLKGGVHLDIVDDRKGHKKNMITQYALKCVEAITPSDRYELIILPIHFHQVAAVLQTLVPVSADALFLHFGSNWNGTEFIDKYLPRERYLMGFPFGGGFLQNGEYVAWIGSKVYLGEIDGNKHNEKLECVQSLFAQADIRTDVLDNILHMLWTSHVGAVGIAAGIAKSQGVIPYLHDRDLMVQSYHIVKELYELCRLRGVDPYRYPEQAFLFRVPVWLFIPVFRLFCTYNVGVQRGLTHFLKPAQDAGALCEAMQKTAQELHFDLPRTKALDPYLQTR
jgi:2-dehydropantoate 2-reductase